MATSETLQLSAVTDELRDIVRYGHSVVNKGECDTLATIDMPCKSRQFGYNSLFGTILRQVYTYTLIFGNSRITL